MAPAPRNAFDATTVSKSYRRTLFVSSLLAAALTSGLALAHGNSNDDKRDGPVVKTVEGPVRGYKKNSVHTYLGIPYAAPPIGNLRWMPPRPVKRWKDTLDATEFGNICPQVTTLGPFSGPSSTTEDCLFLNVFTTGNDRKKKPVIVWIYGGANSTGETNDYDGSKLATGGPNGKETVVVTMNYRVGLFGFNSNPALNGEGHAWGNYGIMDQQAALQWVQRNIVAFGGDPSNVTLGGQSAGAFDTAANLLAPTSAGLFHRAIMQSYPPNTWLTAATALTRGTNFGVAAGCPGSDSAAAACLRNLSSARILQLQGTPNANGPYTQQVFVDGTMIPVQPDVAWATGAFNKMPIMTGNTRDDGNFGLGITQYFSSPQVPQTEAQYLARVPAAAQNLYPLSAYDNSPSLAINAYGSDNQSCRTLHVVQTIGSQVPTYAYIFDYRKAPYHFPKMPGYSPLATHTIDIQFLFPGYHGGQLGVNIDQDTGMPRELNSVELKLSNHLVATWTNFARTGNPNGTGDYPWARSSTSTAQIYSQNLPSTSMVSQAQFIADHKCDYWYPVLGYSAP